MTPKLAFVKYGGLAAGGTERLLQEIAVELVNQGLEIDYFYCEPRLSPGSSWMHPPNDQVRRNYLETAGVKLFEFHLDYKDLSTRDHTWVKSDFFEVFNERLYDLVWTAKAGPREYPFHLLGIPFVEVVTLDAGFDDSPNRMHSILISNWQRNNWMNKGGDEATSSVLPLPVAKGVSAKSLRAELSIPMNATVLGFHQRIDDAIVSPIPFEAIANLEYENLSILVMGGGEKYRAIADEKNLSVTFLPHSSDWLNISRFLKTIDIYTHGRLDGETFGSVLAEAMSYGIPVISHRSPKGANAHVETIANGGFFARSSQEYTLLLSSLVEDLSLRSQVGRNGKAFANKVYSKEAFKNNISEILSNLGVLRPASAKGRNPERIQLVPRVIPNTRVLVHGLPDSWIRRANELMEHIQVTTEILIRLHLNNPMGMVVTGFESLLVAVEIGRGLPNLKLVIYPNNADSLHWINELMNVNGIIDFSVANGDLHFINPEEQLILSFCEDKQTPPTWAISQEILSSENCESKKFYKLNLLLPLFASGSLKILRRKVKVYPLDNERNLHTAALLFLINIHFIFVAIMKFQLSRLRKTQIFKRCIHVKFLFTSRFR
jgi:hypothetical protein